MLVEVLASAVAVLGLVTWKVWSQRSSVRRLKARFMATQPSFLADLPEHEYGRVAGSAHPVGEPLIAPFSGRACVYYVVESFDGTKDPPRRSVIASGGGAFVIDDGTERALVDIDAGHVIFHLDHEDQLKGRSWVEDAQDPRLRAFLRENAIRPRRWHRYCEAIVEVGEVISVLGCAIRDPEPGEPTAAYRGQVPTRLRLIGTRKFPLLVSDDSSVAPRS